MTYLESFDILPVLMFHRSLPILWNCDNCGNCDKLCDSQYSVWALTMAASWDSQWEMREEEKDH